jgi:hypothetical protein
MPGISRRDFLKLAGLSCGSLAFDYLPPNAHPPATQTARCTTAAVPVFAKPDAATEPLRRLALDDLVTVREEVTGENGPAGNPRWFHLLDGFAHTAYLQQVQYRFQPVEFMIPENGLFMEITVPYSVVRQRPGANASALFRAYYESVHWVREVRPDDEGRFWYGIRDDRSPLRYFIRAEHARVFPSDETAPLPSASTSDEKRVDVDLTRQLLTAWEGERQMIQVAISSGAATQENGAHSGKTSTPQGEFRVFRKMPCQHLGNTGHGGSSQEPFDLPGVPWVAYYQADNDGYAFHGAYWHNDFGRPHSHGCINLRPADARWLYRWLDPQVPLEMFTPEALGTRVRIFSS